MQVQETEQQLRDEQAEVQQATAALRAFDSLPGELAQLQAAVQEAWTGRVARSRGVGSGPSAAITRIDAQQV